MLRMMKMGMGMLRVILWFVLILIWFSIFVLIEYFVNYFLGEMINYILYSDDFMMLIKIYVVSMNVIVSFLLGFYMMLMIIGYILMLVGVFIIIQVVLVIVRYIQE